jgi:hypothetical protein
MGNRVVLAGLVFAISGFAAPGVAAAQGPTDDSVVGFANVTPQFCFETAPGYFQCLSPDNYFFNAFSGPAGEAAHGIVVFNTGERLGLRQDRGTVTCLAVDGTNASIGVNFSGIDYDNIPHSAILFVEDNGGAGQDRVGVQDLPVAGSAPAVCPSTPPPGVSLGPTYTTNFSQENMTVTDTRPSPTTRAQCKNGGWRTYGVFDNQGDCVSFVRHQARQACIFEKVAHGTPAFRAKYGIGPQQQLAMWSCIHRRIGS